MSRSTIVLLKWIFLLVSIGLFVLAMVEVWNTSVRVAWRMHLAGWSSYIRRSPSPVLGWLIGCTAEPRCQRTFYEGFRRFYPLWVPVAWIAALYITGILRIISDRMKDRSRILPGAARWANEGEMHHLIQGESGSPQRGYVGILAPAKIPLVGGADPKVLRLPERIRCSHTLAVGGPGARKTTGYHKPNLLADAVDGVSCVLFDLKYPDPVGGFLDVVPLFARRGFDVQLFLPFEEKTLVLALLGDVKTLEDAYDLVDMVVPPPQRDHPSNFYRNLERQLLVALVLGTVMDSMRGENDPYRGPQSFRRIFRLCFSGIREIERYVHTHPDRRVREASAGLFDVEERLLGGIAAGVAGMLQVFDDDRLDRATTPVQDPRLMVDLGRIGEAPTLLYIGIPQEKIQGGRGQLLLQLIKRAVEKSLLQTADRHGGQCPRHVSIYMDEFRAMGYLPNVSEMMATMRSRRVAYHLSLQNRAQGEELYGPSGFRSFFVNNIQTVIIFPRYLKFEDAQYFSDALGYMTVEQRSVGHTRRLFEMLSGSRTDWARDTLRPLLPPEEYPDWQEAMGILFTTGTRPVRVLCPRLDEDEVMKVRNPFARFREEISLAAALVKNEVGRQRVIDILMKQHFDWLTAHYPELQKASGEPGIPWEGREREEDTAGEHRPPTPAPVEKDNREPVPVPSQEARPERAGRGGDGAPDPSLTSSLREWVRMVSKVDFPPGAVRPYMHNRRLTRLGILRAALPPELSVPGRLVEWMSKGWVKVTPSEIALLPRSFGIIGKTHLAAIRKGGGRRGRERDRDPSVPTPMPGQNARAVSRSQPSDAESLAVRALDALREWVRTHGAHLEGHPDRRQDARLLGIYEEGTGVGILPDVIASVLKQAGIPDDLQKVVREHWRDAGWIHSDPGHLTIRKQVMNQRLRVVEFTWSTWDGAARRASV